MLSKSSALDSDQDSTGSNSEFLIFPFFPYLWSIVCGI